MDYIQDLIFETRKRCVHGVSPRTAQSFVACAKAWSFLQNRSFVVPDDVQDVAVVCLSHRLGDRGEFGYAQNKQLVVDIIQEVPVKE